MNASQMTEARETIERVLDEGFSAVSLLPLTNGITPRNAAIQLRLNSNLNAADI